MSNTCHRCENHELGTDCTIQKARFYVVSEDTFMSGWGQATNKKNVCVVPCPDIGTAERVLRYVRSRGDQKGSEVTTHRPVRKPGVLLSNLVEWIKTAKREGY